MRPQVVVGGSGRWRSVGLCRPAVRAGSGRGGRMTGSARALRVSPAVPVVPLLSRRLGAIALPSGGWGRRVRRCAVPPNGTVSGCSLQEARPIPCARTGSSRATAHAEQFEAGIALFYPLIRLAPDALIPGRRKESMPRIFR